MPAAIFAGTRSPPQAFLSSYAPRLRSYGNALLAPIIPQTTALPQGRTTKRGTAIISYAEDGFDDDDFDSEGPRRPTGLRSLRKEDTEAEREKASERGKEIYAPVDVQPVWREWMGKARRTMTEKQVQTQAQLPLVLIPIKIDLDIQPWRPDAPMPLPHNAREMGIDETHPAYKTPDTTPAFRLKDTFLWNLHEALMTPDQFAKTLVDELDLPGERKVALVQQIARQIRDQLEDHSQAALHPLFNPTVPITPAHKPAPAQVAAITTQYSREASHASTPAPATTRGTPLPTSNGLTNGHTNGGASTPKMAVPEATTEAVSATAVAVPPEELIHNPDDAHRVILELRINLGSKLYSDKFEWSLLHPPGFAEAFAKQTCADLGLNAEWVSAMTHAIYEAVLRARKESLENDALPNLWGEIDVDGINEEGVGWRYETERLGGDWAPVVEVLSKEEIENREKERERNMRRMRRETNRYVAMPPAAIAQQSSFFADPTQDDAPMGRGERSKKKRRFRSLSPLGRDTPETGVGAYGGGTSLTDQERATWRCEHCRVWGTAVWAVREGPSGPRTVCHNCGLLFERNGKLPPWSKDLFALDRPYGTR